MKLCLGTVQFGLDYGIKGQKRPEIGDSVRILDYATQNGVTGLDTASTYGSAEEIVGKFLRKKTIARDKLFIVSKLAPNALKKTQAKDYYKTIKDNLTTTLYRLGLAYLDSYILHNSKSVFDDEIMEALYRFQKEGYARKTGVSIYEVAEAKKCIERQNAEFMQLPYSILDQRMLNEDIFEMAASANTQIHSRSVFVQGLILMNEKEVPAFLRKAKPMLKKFDKLCQQHNISRAQVAVQFVKQQQAISHLVFGVDNLEQLKKFIITFNTNISKETIDKIANEFENIDSSVVMPSLWKKN